METTTSLWHRVLHDPQLRDLPFKVETNEHGQIVLSPHKPTHGILQTRISDLLRDHSSQSGVRAVEFAVDTTKGVKVPDVVWISDERLDQIPDDAEASPVVPEIVVEVLSASNTNEEMTEKRRLYFDEGAEEVWTCDTEGQMRFYEPSGETETSTRIPSFPRQIET